MYLLIFGAATPIYYYLEPISDKYNTLSAQLMYPIEYGITFLSFLLTFYITGELQRWWQMRQQGIGQVWEAGSRTNQKCSRTLLGGGGKHLDADNCSIAGKRSHVA